MRIDKWLKVSRLIKRRTIAQMACEQGRVFVSDKSVKPAYEVKVADLIHLEMGSRALTLEVLAVPAGNVPAQSAATLYKVVSEIKRQPEVLEWDPDGEF